MDYQETRIRLQKIRLYNATVLFADATFRGVDVFVSLQNVPSQIVTSLIRNCGGFNTADNDCLVTLEGNLDPVTGRHLNFSDVVISPTVKAPEKK